MSYKASGTYFLSGTTVLADGIHRVATTFVSDEMDIQMQFFKSISLAEDDGKQLVQFHQGYVHGHEKHWQRLKAAAAT